MRWLVETDRIELAFAANGKFFDGLLVTAVSAARYAAENCALGFSILDGGIEDGDFEFLEKSIKDYHPDSIVRRFTVDEALFKNFPTWTGNRMTYARFLLPDFLPNADFVIYSDVDYLWLRDVSELWAQRDPSVVLQGTIDGDETTAEKESLWFAKHGLPYDFQKYICAGFLFINLRLFREENIIGKLGDFLLKYPDAQFPDQAALNVILKDRIRLLPQTWQRFTLAVTNDELQNPIALHYAGDAPWRFGRWNSPLSDQRVAWFKIITKIKHSSFRNELKKVYGSLFTAFVRRLIFLVVSTKWTRPFFYWMLRVTGHSSYIPKCNLHGTRLDFEKYIADFG